MVTRSRYTRRNPDRTAEAVFENVGWGQLYWRPLIVLRPPAKREGGPQDDIGFGPKRHHLERTSPDRWIRWGPWSAVLLKRPRPFQACPYLSAQPSVRAVR